MNYFVFEITPKTFSEERVEILLAVLSALPFDSFEETATGLKAYIPETETTSEFEKELLDMSLSQDFSLTKTFIPYQNWNVLWESNFSPIKVDDFVGLRADFHPNTEGVRFDLVINPKMAFGTGHHETTYMMMQMMRDIDFKGKTVLDYGCGTGILAILASKLEAKEIEGVDIEFPAYENTIENSEINNVHNVKSVHGQLEDIHGSDFDVILANINRNVILDSLSSLKNKLNTEGVLLISGFLKEDEKVMLEAIEKHGFKPIKTLHRGNWLCMKLITDFTQS